MTDCFWSDWKQDSYIFCEKQLCGFVVEPSNTWSNIGYLIVFILMLRSKDVSNKRIKNLFSFSQISLFIGSTFFHLSGTIVGKVMDVGAMFFLSMTILTLALQRYYKFSETKANIFFGAGLVLSLSNLLVSQFGASLFGSQIFLATFYEWKMRNSPNALNVSRIKIAVGFILTAFMIWVLDVKKILCNPDNHILTGHAVWHLLAACAIWTYFTSYSDKRETPTV